MTWLPSTTPLHQAAHDAGALAVMSWNILVPNPEAAWWVRKYYDAAVPEAARQPAARRALWASRLRLHRPDVLCLQELWAPSFETDFAVLEELGYAHLLHRTYHQRPGTAWRADRFRLLAERHCDRALLVLLEERATGRALAVLNVHLSAGSAQVRRRFRQVYDGLDQMARRARALGHAPEQLGIVVCGDFNAHPEGSATHRLLDGETIDAQTREPRWPESELSSKPRSSPVGRLTELHLALAGQPPATLVAARIPALADESSLESALHGLFEHFCDEPERMSHAAVVRWATLINGAPERGSEWRKAMERAEAAGQPGLSRADFVGLYRAELAEGKYWALHHDLQAAGQIPADAPRALWAASLDRLYCGGGLVPVAVQAPLDEARQEELVRTGVGLPNAWHPSDHLPVAGLLRWADGAAQQASSDDAAPDQAAGEASPDDGGCSTGSRANA